MNNAHTSESGFESFLPVSARSLSEAALGSCPPATGCERDEREQTRRKEIESHLLPPRSFLRMLAVERYDDGSVARRAC